MKVILADLADMQYDSTKIPEVMSGMCSKATQSLHELDSNSKFVGKFLFHFRKWIVFKDYLNC